MKHSPRSLVGALAGALVLTAASALAQSSEAGLIGRRYAGADFTYDHFNASSIDQAMAGTAIVNSPLTRELDLSVAYTYADTTGPVVSGIDKALAASLLTHRSTEYGTGYFAATLGHAWNHFDRSGMGVTENGAFWGVRAGYEIPIGAISAVNLGIGYTDAFNRDNARAQVVRYSAEANRWFSHDLAGVLSVSYRQISKSPDAVSYSLGLRWAF